MNGVSASGRVGMHALCEVANFIGGRVDPFCSIRSPHFSCPYLRAALVMGSKMVFAVQNACTGSLAHSMAVMGMAGDGGWEGQWVVVFIA